MLGALGSTIHDIAPFLYPTALSTLLRLRYKRQFRRTVEEAERIITVSRITYSALGIYAGVDQTKARVIHNGVSERFKPVTDRRCWRAARSRHSSAGTLRVLGGRLQAREEPDLPDPSLGAPAGAHDDVPSWSWRARSGVTFARIQDEVRKHGLEEAVMFSGFIPDDDLPAVYSAASAFVFPSLYEGFGLPPLEAMACGTPCVVCNSSSLPEVTGTAALLFNPTSREGFVDCMIKVLTQPEFSETLRQAGLRQAALFSWKRAAEETLQVYREAIRSRATESSGAASR